MRTRRPPPFRPDSSFALEDRIVLSDAGLAAPAALAAQVAGPIASSDDVFRFPTERGAERPALMNQVEARINTAFATFAEDYRVLLTRYFDAVGGLPQPGNGQGDINNGDSGDDNNSDPGVATPQQLSQAFNQAVNERATRLRSQVNELLDEVQGGGGLLDNYARARVDQLAAELAAIPALGVGPLIEAEFAVLGEQAIRDALFAVNRFAEVYDAALFQTAAGIFSGNLRFFRGGARPSDALPLVSPAVGPVIDGLNDAFASFAGDLRAERSAYFDAAGEGDPDAGLEAYRDAVSGRAEALRTEAIDAINLPAGGAGLLDGFATAQLEQVQQSLALAPPVGTTPFGPDAHALLTEQIVARSLNDLRATVELFDISLSTTALNFFNANPRFRALAGFAQRAAAPAGIGSAAQLAGEATAAQSAGGLVVGPGTGTIGTQQFVPPNLGFQSPPTGLAGLRFNPGPFFGTTPPAFNPSAGFGGLGGGFNFGRPVSPGAFGTGFGFGNQTFPFLGPAGVGFGQGLGFGQGGAFGLGNSFGVVAGRGLGTGLGFGGFFV